MTEDNEHIKNLIAARDKEVTDRRDVAAAMAAQHQRGHAEDMREAIILIQNAIEAIDRAIADERRTNVPTETKRKSVRT
jgi:hypothetical protein